MKRCLLMFGILIIVLLLAVFTKAKPNTEFEHDFAVGENIMQNAPLAQELRDTIN